MTPDNLFFFFAGVCFAFALLEIARLSERDDDRRINAQRFDAPTHAGR
jgi:hypothetical protein